jgi:hypothetical protein
MYKIIWKWILVLKYLREEDKMDNIVYIYICNEIWRQYQWSKVTTSNKISGRKVRMSRTKVKVFEAGTGILTCKIRTHNFNQNPYWFDRIQVTDHWTVSGVRFPALLTAHINTRTHVLFPHPLAPWSRIWAVQSINCANHKQTRILKRVKKCVWSDENGASWPHDLYVIGHSVSTCSRRQNRKSYYTCTEAGYT